MNRNKLGIICMALFVAGTAWAANQVFNDKGESSIQIQEDSNGLQLETKEVRYLTDYLGDYSKQMLIKVTTTISRNTGQEGGSGESIIEGRSQKDFYGTPVWTVTDQGETVQYGNDDLLISRRYGCCGDFTRSTLYNVETGKSPGTYLDEDFYTISVPNSGLGNRYMAQIDDTNAPKKKNDKDYIGSIAYLNGTDTIATVRFYAKVPFGWGAQIMDIKMVNLAGAKSKNEIHGKNMELWDADGEKSAANAFRGFGMTGAIDFDNQHLTLQVPVQGDSIDQNKIKVSPGLEFEILY